MNKQRLLATFRIDENTETIEKMKKENLFFLGAGASVFAGIPVIKNFREKAIEVSNNYDIPDMEKVLSNWKKFGGEINIEEYFSIIQMKNVCMVKYDIVPDQVINLIRNTIEKSLDYIEHGWYKNFLTNITSKNTGIITPNWDTIPELFGNMSITYIGINISNNKSANSVLDIIKLRGSLNWNYGDSHVPLIIPPGLFKSESIRIWPGLWKSACIWLRTCKIIHFIGYSFLDFDINSLISSGLEENKNLEKIVIIDMKNDSNKSDYEERHRRVIPKSIDRSKIEDYYRGFENYWKENYS